MFQFATIAEADAYHADHPFAASWEEDMDEDQKRRALIYASRLLFDHVPWLPLFVSRVTPLYPAALRDATSEFARRLFERGDPFAGSDTEGMKRMKAGPVEIEFGTTDSGGQVIPNEVIAMLTPIAPMHYGGINVPLVRY
jgi:hypothetical protein